MVSSIHPSTLDRIPITTALAIAINKIIKYITAQEHDCVATNAPSDQYYIIIYYIILYYLILFYFRLCYIILFCIILRHTDLYIIFYIRRFFYGIFVLVIEIRCLTEIGHDDRTYKYRN